MAKYCKKFLALMLAIVLALGCVANFAPQAQAAGAFTSAGGWNETIYAEIEGIHDADVTAVSYSGAMSGQLVGQDLEFLVRQSGTKVRIDIPGLKPGTYSLTVTAGGVTYSQSGIEVAAHDRSGYAHWNYTEGVGAYNDDGTLKANATVLYVTEESKETVTLTAGGITVTGIGNILNSGGKSVSGGYLSNTNGGILQKLADENRPLVVRIIGHVTKPQGVTAWGSRDYGGNPDDNGGMAYMKSCKNITIEGIGTDALVDGWGFGVNLGGSDVANGYGRNFEFRNLTFKNVPEDCIGLSGDMKDGVLETPITHCWVHNCAFYGPKNLPDASADQDKGGGDGALDFKKGEYMTMSYCYYEGYHKTHLLGGGDSDLQYNVTWHHNYYKNCESRGPLGRQANLHIYNNLVEGQSSYCMRATANCYIYAEYNNFINSKRVSDGSSGGMIKSYNNNFVNSTGTTVSNMVIATSRDQQVSSTNKYPNFDTNPEYGYLASGNYSLQTDTAAAMATVKANAGPMDFGKNNASSEPVEPETPAEMPLPSAGDYTHDFTANGTTNSFFTISGNLSNKGTVNYNGLALTQCLKMESATTVTFTAPTSGKLVLVFHETGYNGAVASDNTVDVDGKRYNVELNNTVTIALAAGEHTLKRGSAQIYLYYMFWSPDAASGEHTHSYTAAITTPATCYDSGVKTFTCACGESYTEVIPATGHNYVETVTAASCTSQGYSVFACGGCGDAYIDNYTPKASHTYANGKCSVCGAKDPDYHECSYTASIIVPTCTAQGYTIYTCTCGDSYADDYVNATGHSYTSSVVAPTCETEGVRTFNCACGDTYTETIAATGHSFADGICSVCGEKDPNYVAPNPDAISGIHKAEDGNFYYYVNDEVATSFTGLADNSVGTWYILNGQVQTSYDGLITYEGTKYDIKAGMVSGYDGLKKMEGTWLYFDGGVNDVAFEGLSVKNGMACYVQNGQINFNKTDVVSDNGTLKYVKYGIVCDFDGLVKGSDGVWRYVESGVFTGTYEGLAKNSAGWWYVTNSLVDTTYTGLATNSAGTWYVKWGQPQVSFTGTVTLGGVTYNIKNGLVQ